MTAQAIRRTGPRGIALAASLALLVTTLLSSTPARSASVDIRIYAAYFNPVVGPDPQTNAGRNMEYIVVRNYGTATVNLRGWVLFDLPRVTRPSSRYTFPNFSLRPGRTVKIHTGTGRNTSTDLYWGLTYYTWGDHGETATLQNAAGVTVSTCSWLATDASPRFC